METVILSEEKLKPRVRMLKHLVAIAWECFQINSFNAAHEIVAAFDSAAVHRLKQTWHELARHHVKTVSKLRKLCAACSPENNRKAPRELLQKCTPPCVPYLGIFLSDLTFIEEGNPDKVVLRSTADESRASTCERDGSPHATVSLINFEKRRKVAEVIRRIQTYQDTPYKFVVVEGIREYLIHASEHTLDEDALWEASLRCEAQKPQR